MEAWVFFPVTYVPDRPLPQVWPLPASAYDRATGDAAFEHALEQMEYAEALGFDGVDVAEHHYAAASLTPNPTVMAGAVSQRIKKARIAMLGSAPDVQPAYSAVAAAPEAGAVATAAPASVEHATDKALSAEQFVKRGLQFCGSPDTVFAQIKRLRDETGIGIIDFVFQGPSLPHAMLMRSLELFGKHVLPRMHEL